MGLNGIHRPSAGFIKGGIGHGLVIDVNVQSVSRRFVFHNVMSPEQFSDFVGDGSRDVLLNNQQVNGQGLRVQIVFLVKSQVLPVLPQLQVHGGHETGMPLDFRILHIDSFLVV